MNTTRTKFLSFLLVVALMVLSLPITIFAAGEVDLMVNGSSATINGAYWQNLIPHTTATGTGTFDSFLRVQNDDTESGHNGDHNPYLDEKDAFTTSKLLSEVPIVYLPGNPTPYREFQLDINENDTHIILDRFQVWLTSSASLTGYDESSYSFPTGAILVYDTIDTTLKLKYADGSGKREYRVLIPQSMFAGKAGQYVVLYTQHSNTSAGFEEWGVQPPQETVNKTVRKVWSDNNNQDGIRPTSVSVQLKADGENWGPAVVLGGNNNWSYTWENLLKYSGNKLISYSVVETPVPSEYSVAYSVSGDIFTVTNTHTPVVVSKTATKTWVDGNNQDGIRPASVSVQLKADGVNVGSPVSLSAPGWSYTWNNLPKFNAGVAIVYTVVETVVPAGYAVGYSADTFSITNTHIPDVVSKTATKNWVDGNNQDGIRPASVIIQLKADGNNYGNPVALDAPGWSYTWNNLPKFNAGVAIVYTVVETVVPAGYAVGYSADTFSITNTHIPDVVSKTVTKIWDDNEDEYGIRPDSIFVQLMVGDANIGDPVSLSAPDWSYTWNNLPKYNMGIVIEYSVEEIEGVSGYTTTYSEDTFTITNTYISSPALSIVKDVQNTSASANEPYGKFVVFDEGEIARYRLVVKNDGNVTLYNVTVSDDQAAPLTPVEIPGKGISAFDGTSKINLGTLLPGESVTILYTYITLHADIDRSPINNIATVTGMTADEQVLRDDDSAMITVDGIPLGLSAIKITKQVKNETAGGAYADLANGFIGDKFNYIITVTNTGSTKLSNVILTDNKVAIGTAVLINGGPSVGAWINIGGVASIVIGDMESGASVSFSYSYNSVAADEGDAIVNTAIVNAVYKPEREGYEDVPLTDDASAAITVVGIPITGETGSSTAVGLAFILAGVVALILRRRHGKKQMDI